MYEIFSEPFIVFTYFSFYILTDVWSYYSSFVIAANPQTFLL